MLEDLELLSKVELSDVIEARTTYSLSCVSCGVEVSAPDKETLLRMCKDWVAHLVQEYTGARSYSLYYCAFCPLCYAKLRDKERGE
ncbi:MAG: hypothetical protein ACTSSA_11960 [Candidatus Freyarchaeota archaeon]